METYDKSRWVRVVSCKVGGYWYDDQLGEVFEVVGEERGSYQVAPSDREVTGFIDKYDAVEVDGPNAGVVYSWGVLGSEPYVISRDGVQMAPGEIVAFLKAYEELQERVLQLALGASIEDRLIRELTGL